MEGTTRFITRGRKKEDSFSPREKARMRGYMNKRLSDFIPSPRPFYARAAGYSRSTQKPGIKERELRGQSHESSVPDGPPMDCDANRVPSPCCDYRQRRCTQPPGQAPDGTLSADLGGLPRDTAIGPSEGRTQFRLIARDTRGLFPPLLRASSRRRSPWPRSTSRPGCPERCS